MRYLLSFILALLLMTHASAQLPVSRSNEFGNCLISIGYAHKDWVYQFEGQEHHLGFDQRPGSGLNGIQLGISYKNKIAHSYLGWLASADIAYFTAKRGFVHRQEWDKFTEYNLHLQWLLTLSLPITRSFEVIPMAGVGMNWAALGYFHDSWYLRLIEEGFDIDLSNLYSIQHYSSETSPMRHNLQLEYGCAFSFSRYQLSVMYAQGLTNHHQLQTYQTHQIQLTLSLGIFIF